MPSIKRDERKSWRVDLTGIIKIPLPSNWFDDFKSKPLNADEITAFMSLAAEKGYLIGIEYAPNEKRYAVYAQGVHKDNPNAGIRTYSNAPTFELAMTSLFYKVAGLYKWGVWSNDNDLDTNEVT